MVGFGSIICFTALSDIGLFVGVQRLVRNLPLLRYFKAFTNSTSSVMVISSPTKMAASFKGRIPGQAVIFAVDLGGCRDSNSDIPQGSSSVTLAAFNCKRYLAVTPRMVRSPWTFSSPSSATWMSVDLNNSWELLHMEEVCALEGACRAAIACFNGRGIYLWPLCETLSVRIRHSTSTPVTLEK